LVNEHGLKEHFKGAGILSGYLWGLSGLGMLLASPLGGLTYVAHVLYWFWRVKLEYPNHALAGVIMLLSAFFFRGEFLQEYRWDLIAIFSAYLITGYIQTYFKEKFKIQNLFDSYRVCCLYKELGSNHCYRLWNGWLRMDHSKLP
jgi:MFS family permease